MSDDAGRPGDRIPGIESVLVFGDFGARRQAYQILSSAGYRVFEASSSEEVTEVLDHAERLPLVLIGVSRFSSHDVALCEELRVARGDIRILLTTPGGVSVGSALLNASNVTLLTSPFTPVGLLQSVREALDG